MPPNDETLKIPIIIMSIV